MSAQLEEGSSQARPVIIQTLVFMSGRVGLELNCAWFNFQTMSTPMNVAVSSAELGWEAKCDCIGDISVTLSWVGHLLWPRASNINFMLEFWTGKDFRSTNRKQCDPHLSSHFLTGESSW